MSGASILMVTVPFFVLTANMSSTDCSGVFARFSLSASARPALQETTKLAITAVTASRLFLCFRNIKPLLGLDGGGSGHAAAACGEALTLLVTVHEGVSH